MFSKKIVLLSTADWDNPFWTNKQHVATELSKIGYEIFYIDSLGLRKPSLNARPDLLRIIKRVYKGFLPPRKVSPNIRVWSPLTLPYRNLFIINFLNKLIFQFFFGSYRMFFGFSRKSVLWTYSPITKQYLSLDTFSLSIYHCVDEIKFQPGMQSEALDRFDSELCKSVDIIFTTAPNLYSSRKLLNRNTYFHPNVADFSHFNKATSPGITPSDIKFPQKKVVGFIGAVSSYKLDFTLIENLAKCHEYVEFVMIGKVGEGDPETSVDKLNEMNNVHFLGPKPYNDLPDFLRRFDVAIIPAIINEYTKNMFPMKFFEYLAAGKPVVTTAIPALRTYADTFFFAENREEFGDFLKAALDGNPNLIQKGISLAKSNTYKERTAKMLDVINRYELK